MSLEAAQALSGYKSKCLLVILSGLRDTGSLVDRRRKKIKNKKNKSVIDLYTQKKVRNDKVFE